MTRAPTDLEPTVAFFAPFEADFAQRTLTNGTESVHLAPSSWRLLELFVRHAGSVVAKDEVKRAIWPDEHATDYALSRAVRRLRESLDDDARSPRYLRTVHGEGFQWIAGGLGHDEGTTRPTSELPHTFVGRHRHIEQLAGAAATASRGRRQCVAIEGALGAGKSTLVEEFAASNLDGWWIAAGRCTESRSEQEPFAPVMEALDRLATAAPTNVVPVLRRFAPTWLAQMPWLVTERDRDDLTRAIAVSSPARMMRELTRCFEELTLLRPIVLWLDDVHWADPATVDAIDATMSRVDDARLLVMTCHRPDDARSAEHPITALLAERSLHGDVRRIVLDPFDRGEVRELIDARLQSLSTTARSELTANVMHWTAGNPLFASVAIDRLHERAESGDRDPRIDVASFPSSLTVLLDDTIDRLDDGAGALLEVASLIDDTIDADVVAAVAGRDAVEVEETIRHVTATTPVLVPVDAVTTGAASRFAHAAFRERVRARVGDLRARRLHRLIGDALEERGGSTVDPRVVAHHLDRGGEARRAVPYWLSAAAQSLRRFAHHDAAEMYERAVSTVAEDDAADPAQEIVARLGLAMCHVAVRTSNDEVTQRNIDRLTDLVSPLRNDADALPTWRATLLVNNLAGRTDRVREMAPALLSMAESRGDPAELVDAHHSMGEASLHAGRLDAARRHFEDGRRRLEQLVELLPDPTPSQLLRSRDVGARLESACAGIATLQDRPDDALRHVDASLELTLDGVNTPLVRVGNLTICASIRWLVGDVAGAVELADRALDEAGGENDDFAAIARVVRWAARGVPPAADARASVKTMLDRPTVPFPLGLIVFFRADLLPPFEMLEWLDAAEHRCTMVDTHWADAEWHRQRARLLRLDGTDDAAVASHLRTGRDVAIGQSAAFLLADIDRDLAALASTAS